MKKKTNNHGFAKLLALLIILAFIYVTNSNHDTKVPDRPLSPDQKKALRKEKDRKAGKVNAAQNIPDKVYEDTLANDKFANILSSNKKAIYYAYPVESSDDGLFLADFENLMKSYSELQSYYNYYPDPQDSTSTIYCSKAGSTYCIQNYLFKNCSSNMCIINPYKKQILKISNKNYRHAFDKIYEYKHW